MKSEKHTFWEHLDDLRGVLLRVAAVVAGFGCVAFGFKDTLFGVVLAPQNSDFVSYRLLQKAGSMLPFGEFVDDFSIKLINTGLAGQFLIHFQVAMYAGVLVASPYILYVLFRFLSPALYAKERRYALYVVGGGYAMFLLGILLSYFLIFPLTFRFLGTYQVSAGVENLISLESYIDTLMTLSLAMGAVFEIPILCWCFAKLGFLKADFMQRYRRHAIIVLLIIAAIITPTSDIFTLLIVSLPMYLLYEASIWIVKKVEN
ncbi:MAG: twin-arginine translocase subunit TatC [Prevotellaceae bacterium]|nr:twin-arginine translocase subunit TatC [Prevotellaceae bacterium]